MIGTLELRMDVINPTNKSIQTPAYTVDVSTPDAELGQESFNDTRTIKPGRTKTLMTVAIGMTNDVDPGDTCTAKLAR